MPRNHRSPRRRLPPRLLLLVASSLLSLLLAELAVGRLFESEIDPERIAERNARTSFGAVTRPSPIPGLVYELRPGTRVAALGLPLLAISPLGPYRIGAAGERPVPPSALRIAVLGDSTPFGWGVSFDASYPEVWGRSLSEHVHRPVAVRNLSAPGYNTAQERLVLEHRALSWRPHLLLLHYDHNDWEPAIREKPPSYLDPAYGDNPLGSSLLKLLARRLRIARERGRHERLRSARHALFEGYAYAGPLYEDHLTELRRIGEIASAQGIPVLCLVFDAFLRSEDPAASDHYRLLHRPLVAALAAAGFHVLELFHPYQGLMADQGWGDLSPLWLAPDDAHPSEAGHGLIAQALTRYLLASDSLRAYLAAAPSPAADPP